MKKINKTLKALIITHEMNWVKDWEYLTFAEKLWVEEFPNLFKKVYWTWRWVCVWKWPRFMAWSFLARLQNKWLISSWHESFCWDYINIREVSHEWYKYIKENISWNLPIEYIELLKETINKWWKYSLWDLYWKPHERNSNITYRRLSLLRSCWFVKWDCNINEIIFEIKERWIEEIKKY